MSTSTLASRIHPHMDVNHIVEIMTLRKQPQARAPNPDRPLSAREVLTATTATARHLTDNLVQRVQLAQPIDWALCTT